MLEDILELFFLLEFKQTLCSWDETPREASTRRAQATLPTVPAVGLQGPVAGEPGTRLAEHTAAGPTAQAGSAYFPGSSHVGQWLPVGGDCPPRRSQEGSQVGEVTHFLGRSACSEAPLGTHQLLWAACLLRPWLLAKGFEEPGFVCVQQPKSMENRKGRKGGMRDA